MKAYVSIRGSRSHRRVDRDASPEYVSYPYAALHITHEDGSTTRYELSYRTHGSTIAVELSSSQDGGPLANVALMLLSTRSSIEIKGPGL